mgnify:CR=1 FL=1
MSVSLCFRGAFLYCDESKFELPGTLTTAYNLRMCLLALLMIVTVSYSILFPFSLHTVFVKISFLFLLKSFSDNFIGFHNDRKCFRVYLFYHSFYRIHLLVIACTHDHVFFFTTIASYTFQNR